MENVTILQAHFKNTSDIKEDNTTNNASDIDVKDVTDFMLSVMSLLMFKIGR